MKRLADCVKGSNQQNPFSDSQARNFSDTKLINEFCPISNYWSLFNDQHEILLGTRGSGKTYLLKMMRYSMLKRIQDPKAQQLAKRKEYIALYVPMYLEFVTHFTNTDSPEEKQIQLFQFAFNCLLAESLLVELKEILSEESDKMKWAKITLALSSDINNIWFGNDEADVSDLFSLSTKIRKLFYNFDVQYDNVEDIPSLFKRQIGATLLAVKETVAKHLGLSEEPTWIICIDEAEFLTEPLQRCINGVFRSDSGRIALKVATLPYYHRTLKTLIPNISVSAGNDFCYRVVDMKYDGVDFYNLTNSLCAHRMKSRFNPKMEIDCLEDFVGTYGNDDQIDYYRNEVGKDKASYNIIMDNIIEELSDERKKHCKKYTNPRKEIYDKYAPIFYVRSMFKLSKKGNYIPGWYAGSQMIRKIAQGNPRAYIQIMNNLFEKARKSPLTPKAQHKVILDYAMNFCNSTQALEVNGPTIYRELKNIADVLKANVHDSYLKSAGCNFVLKFDNEESFLNSKSWIEQAIAYSRIFVDTDTIKNGITLKTEYMLANTFAAYYWLPMRADISPKHITIQDNQVATYIVKISKDKHFPSQQISFFEEDE